MRLFLGFSLTLLALTGQVGHAQQAPHICGAGPGPNEVQAGVQPGGNGMAPTPLCYWRSEPQLQHSLPPRPTGYWETTWGAIAGHSSKPILGTAVGANSEAQAREIALQDCKAKGGGAGCRLDIAYHNQCAVLVTGDNIYITYSAASIKRAAELGMAECGKADTNCRVYYSACTEPIFHYY